MSRLKGWLLDRVGRRWRQKVCGVLYICDHNGRRVEVELLDRVVGTKGEKAGAGAPNS